MVALSKYKGKGGTAVLQISVYQCETTPLIFSFLRLKIRFFLTAKVT